MGFIFAFMNIKNTFRSLQYRNYLLFFSGQSISLIGTWTQRIATPWLVYRMTNSPLLLGLVAFAGQLPTFLISPYAGVITDRIDRYKLLLATQVLAMIQAFILCILFFMHALQVWHIVALGIFLGVINAFDVPARQSLVIKMVDNKEDLGNAIALNSSMVNAARLIGPSIAGLLIAYFGEGYCFLINGISYLFVLTTLSFIKIKSEVPIPSGNNLLKEFREGFAYTFNHLTIRALMLLLALVSLVGMPYTILMPIFAGKILHGSSHTFGFLMAATGIGALVGSLYMASRKTVTGLERLIPVATLIFGCGIIVFSLSRNFYFSFIILLFTGLGMIFQMAASNTIIQTIVDDNKRGRVMSFYTMAFMGTAPFGSILAGWSAKLIGAPATLIIGGVGCIAGSIAFLSVLPKIRKMLNRIYAQQHLDKISSEISLEAEP
jgi:MFS family permease